MSARTHDLRMTFRKLARTPLFTAIAVLTLAVGIGSTAAIFSVVNGVLLRPLPFHEPESLVGIWHAAPGLGFPEVNQSPALHFTYATDSRTFESVGMWSGGSASVTGIGEPEQVDVMSVTHQTLPMLGVPALVGRTFSPEEDAPGGPYTAVLAHGYWQSHFGGDPGVLGQTVAVNGISREIIGVMPADFRFLRSRPALYLPLRFDESNAILGNFSYQGIGRLRPGASVEQANADVERMIPVAAERYPRGLTLGMLQEARFGAQVRPLKQDVVGDVGSVLWVLLGTVGIVLLIACANVANLFIVRAEGREREIAVRTALGAGRRQIAGQLLQESVVLGMLGGTVGLGLAFLGLRLLVALGPGSVPRLDEIGLDPVVLAFALAISLLTGILFGLLPALQYGRPRLAGALKEGGRGGSAGKERHAARNGLVVAQVSLALVLLAGSGLMFRSFQALRAVEPGFEAPESVLYFRVTVPSAEVDDLERVALTHQEILRNVQAVPGVASAAFASSATMDGWTSNDPVHMEDFPVDGERLPPIRRFKHVGEGYFSTMGNRIVAGREITWADIEDRADVVVVTENLAREYWSDPAEALGRRVAVFAGDFGTARWREIVGVAADIRDDGMHDGPVATVYWPQVMADFWDQELFTQRSLAYVVRVRAGDPTALLPQVREAVWSVNPNLPLARVTTLDGFVRESMARTSFTLVMLAVAAAVALFLGAVGVYGVISYVVAQRTREIGVRMALGAQQAAVRRMVLRQAGALAAAGVLVGLVGAGFLTRLMASLLYGVDPIDVPTFAAVAAGLGAIALAAAWVPARRASAVDPMLALRAE